VGPCGAVAIVRAVVCVVAQGVNLGLGGGMKEGTTRGGSCLPPPRTHPAQHTAHSTAPIHEATSKQAPKAAHPVPLPLLDTKRQRGSPWSAGQLPQPAVQQLAVDQSSQRPHPPGREARLRVKLRRPPPLLRLRSPQDARPADAGSELGAVRGRHAERHRVADGGGRERCQALLFAAVPAVSAAAAVAQWPPGPHAAVIYNASSDYVDLNSECVAEVLRGRLERFKVI